MHDRRRRVNLNSSTRRADGRHLLESIRYGKFGDIIIIRANLFLVGSVLHNRVRLTNDTMIARIWKGRTTLGKYEDYTQFLSMKAKPDYESVPGNLGFHFLRKVDDKFGYFELITFWDSIESIKEFAGDDYQKAKYYPEDDGYLLEFAEHVEHFEVFDSLQIRR